MRWAPAPTWRDGARWWLGRHRRAVAAVLAAISVWAGLSAVRTGAAPTDTVLVAARDLPPGTVLAGDDVHGVAIPTAAVPPTALRPGARIVGRAVAVAVPAGVPLTPASLSVGRVLPTGTVATPVRLADPGEAALVVAGDKVDVLAARSGEGLDGPAALPPATPTASPRASSAPTAGPAPFPPADPGTALATRPSAGVIAAGVLVLAVPVANAGVGDQGGLLVLAATPGQAAALAQAAAVDRLSVTVRRG